MNRHEMIPELCSEFTGRVAKYHSQPSSIFITVEEMEELTEKFPSNLILQAMNQTSKVVKKYPATQRISVLRNIKAIAKSLLQRGEALCKHMQFPSGDATAKHDYSASAKARSTPTAAPKPKVEDRITSFRGEFQDLVTDGSWTITEDEALTMLKQHGEETIRPVLAQLNRQYTQENQQECLDLLEWKLSVATL